jgi:hypothetical protein
MHIPSPTAPKQHAAKASYPLPTGEGESIISAKLCVLCVLCVNQKILWPALHFIKVTKAKR